MNYEFKIGDYVKFTKDGQDELVHCLRTWIVSPSVDEKLLKNFSKKIFKIIHRERIGTSIASYRVMPIENIDNGCEKTKDILLKYNKKFSETISVASYYLEKYKVNFLKQWGAYARI